MKKILLLLAASLLTASVFAAPKNYVENSDGSVSISAVDKDASVKAKQKADGFKNVTIVDGTKISKLNPVTISLEAFGKKEILLSLSVDLKIDDKTGGENDIVWMINDLDAGMPVIAQKKVKSGEWTTMTGSTIIALGEKKSLYISGSGLEKGNLTFYIKDLDVHIEGEGIGKGSAPVVSWVDAPSLKDAYKDYFDKFGIAINYRGELAVDEIQEGLKRHASSITLGNELKPDFLFNWAKPNLNNLIDFTASDGKTYKMPQGMPHYGNLPLILMIAQEMDVQIRGHVLVWHSQTPHWFFTKDFDNSTNAPYVDRDTMTARQEWYIKSVLEYVADWEAKKNKGKHIIYTWDVVNEAVADGAGSQKWLREDSDWFRVYGDETFILNAFRFANKYAPSDVTLVYNDYGCYNAGKRQAICNLIDEIKAYPGARLDAVGMQSHVRIDYPAITGHNSYEEAVQAFVSHGVNVQVTELDIANGKKNYSPIMLKGVYKSYFQMFLNNRKTDSQKGIESVTIWGLTDDGTWLDNQAEYKGYKQYPLLLNGDFSVKPAFTGVLEAAQGGE